jgi:hypothetical protein
MRPTQQDFFRGASEEQKPMTELDLVRLPGAAALSVGQSYKDFYVVESPTLDRGQDATSTKSQRHPL